MSTKELKILVVGSRSDSLVAALASSASVEAVGSVEAAEEKLLTNQPPDLILLDTGRRALAIKRVRKIKSAAPDTPILVMAGESDPDFLQEAIEAGAVGILGSAPSPAQVGDAIEVVRAGGSYIDPVRTKGIFEALGTASQQKEQALTKRELEVLRLLFEGLTARQIAKRLGLSERTVNTHVANVYRKLGASNRIEAIRIAMRMGMLSE